MKKSYERGIARQANFCRLTLSLRLELSLSYLAIAIAASCRLVSSTTQASYSWFESCRFLPAVGIRIRVYLVLHKLTAPEFWRLLRVEREIVCVPVRCELGSLSHSHSLLAIASSGLALAQEEGLNSYLQNAQGV